MTNKQAIEKGKQWFKDQGWKPFPFQIDAWEAYLDGKKGIINAPTGSGKTYSLIIPILLEFLKAEEKPRKKLGLRAIWITPMRALTKDIQSAAQRAATELGLDWKIAIRSGDTSTSERAKQKRNPPQILITTPESLHLLLATKDYPTLFKNLKSIVIDEWHELIGSKRGVLVELGLSRLRGLNPALKTWGISATIGNMEEAIEVLLGKDYRAGNFKVIKADIEKKIKVKTVLPDEIERFPWSGHLGIKLLDKVLPLLHQSTTTLIFTNTRAQCEIWYQRLLEADDSLAGVIAMHHSSLDRKLRDWVENALHAEMLKAVVCTSSLDLGVDFRPVETIVQIGSPKGVARFMQRAGRSGHRPGAESVIYFVPTNSMELIEAAALRKAIKDKYIESRIPYVRSFDVLVQYLVTLAVSEGFFPKNIFPEVKETHCFSSITDDEWAWCLDYITTGGNSLEAYDEYQKVEIEEDGLYKVNSRRIAMRHRLSIGAIVSDANLLVKFVRGGRIGTIGEWFASQLSPGDTFWFAGRNLELVRIKDMQVQVKKSRKKAGKVPSWQGSRMEFSSQLSTNLKDKLEEAIRLGLDVEDPELLKLMPLIALQAHRSHVPETDEFLIEYFKDREGYHLVFYPFEGHYIHEGMAALMAYRIGQLTPITFSIAKNDYGFELLSDVEIPIDEALKKGLFSDENLYQDIQASINEVEMAKRQFRDIASISGLVFKGFPGKQKKDRHLQSSSQLFFQVFNDYEPNNLLLRQAHDEVMTFQLQETRLRAVLNRLKNQRIIVSRPAKATPFSFGIIVDRLRSRFSSEKLEDRIAKMKLQLIKD